VSEVENLIEGVLSKGVVQIFSVNEAEAILFASKLEESLSDRAISMDVALEGARILRDSMRTRVDLHTSEFTATFGEEGEFTVPTFMTEAKVVTGAGDAWNAADIYGYIIGLEPPQRLLFANAVASL